MALAKTGYSDAINGTTKVKVAVDAEGYLVPAQGGNLPVGGKNFQISRVNSENGLIENMDVINFFLGLANARTDSDTNTMAVTWEV